MLLMRGTPAEKRVKALPATAVADTRKVNQERNRKASVPVQDMKGIRAVNIVLVKSRVQEGAGLAAAVASVGVIRFHKDLFVSVRTRWHLIAERGRVRGKDGQISLLRRRWIPRIPLSLLSPLQIHWTLPPLVQVVARRSVPMDC
ncbi:MAG: hypothetical protein B7X65_17095 [Polaromonas sp. 39-63-25]|nr:MAG: hypothetical protein B7Y60_18425 [Polaromonas sp. 35-63-35]OYZ18148.1 MAG: hypothetical protein B7Y28_16900 [Polaromonas sp. 16-63-31]OYZ77134.1 MAG: hypothetical protein B7Y09_17745 [Polaromonas sp. 24-63-21]OZA51221.1 MAG: hypothetical protein B7X88_06235 [Polaromonas sp. 17-63-33]OZA86452.1 MAG: hypothetical protein B7X65_17095 [Polaromonas sp. 39-63-25]